MKILISADLYYPTINGVATFSRNLARGLAERGHEVLVIAPSQIGKPYKEVDGNYVIARTRSVPFLLYQRFRVSVMPGPEVRKIIKEFAPDIIHIQMLMRIGLAVRNYGLHHGIPVISTNHAMPENLMDNLKWLAPASRPINALLREYGVWFYAKSDMVTTPTQTAVDMFKVAKKLPHGIKVVSNGIDLQRFQPEPVDKSLYKKFGIPRNVPIVTFVGRLDVEKHASVLVQAFAKLRAHTDAHLLLVGDGTDAEHLRQLAGELGVSAHVTFTGRVSDEDIVQLHRLGTVFAMPSPAELQSIATLEAMASGQPVVAVNAGALKEICQNGRNGYLCEKDNDEQIAKSLEKIITNPELRAKFSRASLAIAGTHDLQHTLDQFEKLYRQLLTR